jgi:hypothetical protein
VKTAGKLIPDLCAEGLVLRVEALAGVIKQGPRNSLFGGARIARDLSSGAGGGVVHMVAHLLAQLRPGGQVVAHNRGPELCKPTTHNRVSGESTDTSCCG